MKTPDLRWFLLVSVSIHMLFLWRWSWVPLCEPLPPAPLKTDLLSGSLYLSSEQPAARGQGRAAQGKPFAQQGEASSQQRTDRPNSSTATGEGTTAATGGTAYPDGGSLSAGVGSPSVSGGTSAGAGGTSSAAQGGSSGTQGASGGGGKTASTGTKTSVASTPIPELAEHRYRRYNSYFVEVDHYVLEGMNIPGTDLCVAGDQLRTKGPIAITQLKTDHSKCRVRTRGDEEKEICPPGARNEAVVFVGHLASPLTYSVNSCREYDRSHCRVLKRGTEWEREYCKVDFNYEGVWAAGTIFEYKCINSETVTYRHPLEYNVRYMVDVARNERIVSRQVHRVTQSIPQCD